MASRDFLARHRGWREHGNKSHINRSVVAYDAERTKIENTEFCVLRAPPLIVVDARPMTLGQTPFTKTLSGIRVELAQRAKGTLHIQCVVRTFGTPPEEFIAEKTFDITDDQTLFSISLDVASATAPDTRQTVEPWLTWEGASELRLASVPAIF
jgi:hypothetical protein